MNSEQLLVHFDRISEAPDAVAQLRRFVRELSVRGKLVEQEQTATLLRAPADDSTHYDIPDSWRWTTVGEVADFRLGKMLDKAKNKGTPRRFSEYWTFIRRRGAKESGHGDKNCPNCGAPLKINMAGVCEYCQGKVTSGEFDWVLSKIEQDDSYTG